MNERHNVTPHGELSTLGPEFDSPDCKPQKAPVTFPADIDPLEAALRRMDAAAERLLQDTNRAMRRIDAAFTNYIAAVNQAAVNQDTPALESGVTDGQEPN